MSIFQMKTNIEQWAEVVYGKPLAHPEKETEERLAALTEMLILQDMRIISDSIRLIHTTRNEETRSGRIALAKEKYRHLLTLKPYARPVADKNLLRKIKETEAAMKTI